MKIAGMVVLAALSGWFVRGMRFDGEPEAKPVRRAVQPVVESAPIAEPVPVIQRVPLNGNAALGRRNLFAYRVQERPVIVEPQPVVQVAPAIAAPPAVIMEPPAPQPIPFPYRYIGTFGTAHNRLAAFKRDGEIATVRPGERIGDFVLRSIGMESVSIEGADGVRNVPLATDL